MSIGDFIQYVVCFNCGKISPEREFCIHCHMPLAMDPPKTAEGVPLGSIENGDLFRLPLKYYGLHFAFYGVTGTGKTRSAMNLAIRSENEGVNLRVIDVEGEWKNIIPKLKKETVYYDIDSNLKVNPFDLQDPGLTKLLLMETIFKGIELEYRDISPQMNYLLDKCILVSKSIPQLIANIITYKPQVEFPLRNLDLTRTALLTRLNPFRDNPVLRGIFYVQKSSIDMSSLKDRNLIINLHSLEMKAAYKSELRLIYNILTITYLREALKKEDTQTAGNMFIADEAQILVPKILHKAVVTDTWATTDFATRLRKRGESLVIISQSPANIEDDIRKNAQNLFVFRLLDPLDVRAVSGMFGYLHVDEVNYLSTMLTGMEERCAMVKTPLVHNPFVVRTLDVDLPHLTAPELEKYSPKVKVTKQKPSEDEQALILNITKRPFLNNTERALSLGWRKTKYSQIRKLLISRGIVEEISFKTNIKGAPSRFLKLTSRKMYGRGHFIHGYWIHRIHNHLRTLGFKPKMEYRVNGKVADVAYRKGKQLVFVEVEYQSNWKETLTFASEVCDKVILVVVKPERLADVLAYLKKHSFPNVTVTEACQCFSVL
ncbi:MAG: ATP-binding protein [Candidatus Bathyarchaeota archaeon]|nr:ATP-binding protein [Candidatus Bathyarchaeota archaeon]